jgi:hypothetical protein
MAASPAREHGDVVMAAYETDRRDGTAIEIGKGRTKPGTVAAAVAGYFSSLGCASLAETTRQTRREIPRRVRRARPRQSSAMVQ